MKRAKILRLSIAVLPVLAAGYLVKVPKAKPIAINSLFLVAEDRISESDLQKIIKAQEFYAVASGNTPNAVVAGNFPNSVASGNTPDAITSGNTPTSAPPHHTRTRGGRFEGRLAVVEPTLPQPKLSLVAR